MGILSKSIKESFFFIITKARPPGVPKIGRNFNFLSRLLSLQRQIHDQSRNKTIVANSCTGKTLSNHFLKHDMHFFIRQSKFIQIFFLAKAKVFAYTAVKLKRIIGIVP